MTPERINTLLEHPELATAGEITHLIEANKALDQIRIKLARIVKKYKPELPYGFCE